MGNDPDGGAINDSVDSDATFHFGDLHSNEFEWSIQFVGLFYYTLMHKFNLPQNALDSSHPQE